VAVANFVVLTRKIPGLSEDIMIFIVRVGDILSEI
jgi:hypothetical protein